MKKGSLFRSGIRCGTLYLAGEGLPGPQLVSKIT